MILEKFELSILEVTGTDLFTNQTYELKKEKVVILNRSIESIPVLVKEGSFIVLSKDEGNSTNNPSNLEVLSYFGNGKYDFYEDKNEKIAITKFKSIVKDNKQIITISTKGKLDVIPNNRVMTIKFKNIFDGKVVVYENDKELDNCIYDLDVLAVRNN